MWFLSNIRNTLLRKHFGSLATLKMNRVAGEILNRNHHPRNVAARKPKWIRLEFWRPTSRNSSLSSTFCFETISNLWTISGKWLNKVMKRMYRFYYTRILLSGHNFPKLCLLAGVLIHLRHDLHNRQTFLCVHEKLFWRTVFFR